ncbi:low temperature requirement protein A [Plantactinospora sonchi]|uniref:Low temperature requirement protein A n=1 Tax=Plantactinospora sonchi TaxID=1544735 RepID=A0ABU7RW23_9ACTN
MTWMPKYAKSVAIFQTGRAYSEGRHHADQAVALAVVFATTVLIWRIYIHRAGELMTITIAESANSSRLSQFTAFVHLVLVAGILGTAAANQLVIARPYGDTPFAWAMLIIGGPAVFLGGRLLLDYTVFARIDRARLVGLLLLLALAPATSALSPLMSALIATGVLAAVAAVNLAVTRAHPPRPAPRGA